MTLAGLWRRSPAPQQELPDIPLDALVRQAEAALPKVPSLAGRLAALEHDPLAREIDALNPSIAHRLVAGGVGLGGRAVTDPELDALEARSVACRLIAVEGRRMEDPAAEFAAITRHVQRDVPALIAEVRRLRALAEPRTSHARPLTPDEMRLSGVPEHTIWQQSIQRGV